MPWWRGRRASQQARVGQPCRRPGKMVEAAEAGIGVGSEDVRISWSVLITSGAQAHNLFSRVQPGRPSDADPGASCRAAGWSADPHADLRGRRPPMQVLTRWFVAGRCWPPATRKFTRPEALVLRRGGGSVLMGHCAVARCRGAKTTVLVGALPAMHSG